MFRSWPRMVDKSSAARLTEYLMGSVTGLTGFATMDEKAEGRYHMVNLGWLS